MSRIRNTAEWFPHYANASSGRTLTILRNQYGKDGHLAWWLLLEKMADTENHYLQCSNDGDKKWISNTMLVETDVAMSILSTLSELDAIDSELWTKHHIVWSQHFVDGLAQLYRNRRREVPTRPVFDKCQTCEQHTLNIHSTYTTPTQDIHVDNESNNTHKPYGEFKNVLLSDEEYQKLIDKFGESGCKDRIETLSTAIQSKGYKYKSHYATILVWDRKTSTQNQSNDPDKYTTGKYAHMINRGDEKPGKLPKTYTKPEELLQ